MEVLEVPSIDEDEEMIDCFQASPGWMDEIIEYLQTGNLPTEKTQVRKVRRKAARYVLKGDDLLR